MGTTSTPGARSVCASARSPAGLATRKLPDVSALIEHAEAVQRWLQAAAVCECVTLDDCPLLDGTASPGCS